MVAPGERHGMCELASAVQKRHVGDLPAVGTVGEWQGSGRVVVGQWQDSGRAVAGQWQGSGGAVAGQWQGSGRVVAG
jgi:hypothetical protein